MSTSPLPPDPYEALGVGRDCDVDAIKKAHRKLALKHHPDRIKDPALVEHNKNEFQKVQQAYEILIDPSRRQRYDNECRLAQLQRDRLMSDVPRQTYTRTTYTARPSPAPTNPVQREYKAEPRYAYEERVPDSPYSPYAETTSRGFEDSIPRANARKVDPKADPYERRTSTSKPVERKEKPKASAWERPTPSAKPSAGSAMRMAFSMKAAAQSAKVKVKESQKEKEKEREIRERNAKARDKEEARARDQKNTNARPPPFVEDDSDDESSGSDTVRSAYRPPLRERNSAQQTTRRTLTPEPPRSRRQPSPQSEVRMSRQQSPRPMPRATQQSSPRLDPRWQRQPSPRPDARSGRNPSPRPLRPDQRSMYDEDDDSEDEKYESQFRYAQGYQNIAARKDPRPTPSRQGSDIREYWQPQPGNDRDRRSGSDSDKQRSSSSQRPSRRSMPDEARLRPPLPTQTSAPAGVRTTAGMPDRDPSGKPRSRQNSYASSNHRREMPELKRSGSEPMPTKAPTKRDSAPMKGSSLKQTESAVNHDSGYGSSSSPQTPEHRGDSPPRESRPRETSTKYSVSRHEDALRAKKMASQDGAPLNKHLSPPDLAPHHHSHHHPESRERRGSRSRSREPEGRHRSSSNRPGLPERQTSYRGEPGSKLEEREKPRSTRYEKSPDRSRGYFQWNGETNQMRPKAPTYSSSPNPKFSNFYEGSTTPSSFSRSAGARRPSVY